MPCMSEKPEKKKLGLYVREDLIEAMESMAVATGGTKRDKGMVIHAAIRMFMDASPRAQYDYMKDEVAVKLDEWLAGQNEPDATPTEASGSPPAPGSNGRRPKSDPQQSGKPPQPRGPKKKG